MATPPRAGAPIYVTDVELGRPLAGIEHVQGYSAVRAVARLQGVPVAGVQVPVRDGRVELGALIDALVTGRTAELTRCLGALVALDYPDYDVVDRRARR